MRPSRTPTCWYASRAISIRTPKNKRNSNKSKNSVKLRRRKESYRNNSGGGSGLPSSVRTYAGFPTRKTVTLTYVDSVVIPATSAAGVNSTYTFRANSIFDPDQSSTGHQPMGRDIWCSVYNHYLVLYASIQVTFTPTVTSGVSPIVAGIQLHEDGTATFTQLATTCEQGNTVQRTFYPSLGFQPFALRHHFSSSAWFGIRNVDAALYSIGASVGSNPPDIAAFILFQGSFLGSAPGLSATVSIQYQCLLTEPTEQAGS